MNDPPIILQVEDREEDVYLLKRAIQRAEVQTDIRSVVDGQEAIEYIAGEGRFADRQKYPLSFLILLDLNTASYLNADVR